MSPQPPDLPPDGPGPDAGLEWLFKKGGQVYGPVSAPKQLQMLYRGEIDGGTMVSGDDGAFQSLGSIPAFVVHAKKAEAQVRVEREVTGARALERPRRLRRTALAVALGLAALGGGGYGAWWLATHKPWLGRSALLEDFGNGIAIASPARVRGRAKPGRGGRGGDPRRGAGGRSPRRRASTAGGRRRIDRRPDIPDAGCRPGILRRWPDILQVRMVPAPWKGALSSADFSLDH